MPGAHVAWQGWPNANATCRFSSHTRQHSIDIAILIIGSSHSHNQWVVILISARKLRDETHLTYRKFGGIGEGNIGASLPETARDDLARVDSVKRIVGIQP